VVAMVVDLAKAEEGLAGEDSSTAVHLPDPVALRKDILACRD
jgi:hypothetical protein